MPKVNLEIQMKFLTELDDALTDALGRYADDGAEKLAELEYMKKEVVRAQRIITERITDEDAANDAAYPREALREAAYT
ncbi:MAG: hypothetical protein KUG56_01055 [Kordiimonadaceae bacterium]|nr:hypothetical protein [Kordiimonadaceae bacterium]